MEWSDCWTSELSTGGSQFAVQEDENAGFRPSRNVKLLSIVPQIPVPF